MESRKKEEEKEFGEWIQAQEAERERRFKELLRKVDSDNHDVVALAPSAVAPRLALSKEELEQMLEYKLLRLVAVSCNFELCSCRGFAVVQLLCFQILIESKGRRQDGENIPTHV